MYINAKSFFRMGHLMIFNKKFSLKRAFFFLGFSLFILFMWLILSFFRFLDYIFYPKFVNQRINKPVFIIGNARSGTTMLYEMMEKNKEVFVSPLLFQSLFCSIILFKIINFLFIRKDGSKGVLSKIVRLINNLFSGVKGIHEIRLDKPEEDEVLFFLSLLSPSMFMVCPFPKELSYLSIADNLPEKTKKKLMASYKKSIKRILYFFGKDKIYLNKSVLSTGRIKMIKETFPDARFIYPARDKEKTLPSALNLFELAWKLHSKEFIGKTPETKSLAKEFLKSYHYLEGNFKTQNKNLIKIKFEEFIQNPKKTIKNISKVFSIKFSCKYEKELDKMIFNKKGYKSTKRYNLKDFGLDKKFIEKY